MSRIAFLAIALLAAVSAHGSFEIDPPAPTDAWHNGYRLFDPRVMRSATSGRGD